MTMRKLEAADPGTRSVDVVAQNVERLKELFPELLAEGPEGPSINVDVLKTLVGEKIVTDADEKYGLNWHGKRRAQMLALSPSTGTLRPCPEDSVSWGTTQNLMIEGDNLEVLKLLQRSYKGKVKMIYIDPPYNTGNDFVYADDFKDSILNYLERTGQVDLGRKISSNSEASGRFHTDWLNMMYPRLKLARDLLQEDGVIFISIDDTEQANLRALCDLIMGEENFIANIIWQKKFARQNDAEYFSTMHDHILCYAKNSRKADPNGWLLNLLERTDDDNVGYSNPDNDPRGPWTSVVLSAKSGSQKLIYAITTPSGRECMPPDGRFWAVSADRFEALVADKRIWFGKEGNGVPRLKTFLSEVQSGLRPNTIWFHEEVSHNQEARQSLKELFDGRGVFDSPKPVRLVQRMIQIASADNESLCLDFFAGSGTTGHAVLAQNAADGGRRRYILVQLPEQLDPAKNEQRDAASYCDQLGKPRNIAELTKERLRRAATRIKEENPLFAGDLGFRVFKLDSSNIRAWDPDRENLEQTLLDHAEHLKAERSEEDVLYELLLKLGLDLCVPIEIRRIAGKSVYGIGGGVLLACLAQKIAGNEVELLAQGIVEWHQSLSPIGDTTCVFRDSAFADDVAKTNLAAILNQRGISTVRSL